MLFDIKNRRRKLLIPKDSLFIISSMKRIPKKKTTKLNSVSICVEKKSKLTDFNRLFNRN